VAHEAPRKRGRCFLEVADQHENYSFELVERSTIHPIHLSEQPVGAHEAKLRKDGRVQRIIVTKRQVIRVAFGARCERNHQHGMSAELSEDDDRALEVTMLAIGLDPHVNPECAPPDFSLVNEAVEISFVEPLFSLVPIIKVFDHKVILP
jgi:hypothetical protein